MANAQAMCTSFKKELLLGTHAFGDGTGVPAHTAGAADAFKAALYIAASATALGAATTVYRTTDEVTGSGYTPGGVAVTFGTANNPATSGTGAYTTPTASIVYTTVTLATSFDTVLLYNSSQANKAVATFTFGAQTITAGTLTLTMPVNALATALLQIN
jgi:hypothetical protein